MKAPAPRLPRLLLLSAALALLAGCADKPLRVAQPSQALRDELQAPRPAPAAAVERAAQALPVPAPAPAAPPEPRFDLIVNGAPARDVFLSLVSDTRYSMLVHPTVTGQLSVTLKDVTIRESLDAIRDVYGFDYTIDGRRITVFPPTLQTRVFTINALAHQRSGRSEVRVSSGAAPIGSGGSGGSGGSTGAGASGGGSGGSSVQQQESSQLSTKVATDFWAETAAALRALVGSGEGRTVITSPQTGTVAVRAMPEELRHVEAWLKATRIAVERQVMLEAKIVEVELREGYQSGIDWSRVGERGAIGQTSANPSTPSGVNSIINPLVSNTRGLPTLSSGTQSPSWPDLIPLPSAGGGTFGLALARGGFQALLSFVESHGDTQILSSPRIATLNNQKAVLKVGTDDYFITGISGSNSGTSTGTNGNTTNQIPTLTLTPFFSGIALDVTPQIDAADMITLHIHPSVSAVTEKVKQVDLGEVGNFRLPLASASVNESDTVVRIPDGHIVAIGGLMQMESSRRGSGLPGADANPLTSTLFGNRANSGRKRELVVLIKPSIIRSADDWAQHNRLVSESLSDTESRARRVIRLDGPAPAPAK
ncbi:secretin N-terminal domain-containing protein [Roseateles sp. LKC17W]|uniref:Secretin N-terminal domain-containing protein n=1 Tax=Pelomonas margarita TaxID=3299031 RepID=A0ABW7FMJ5_9BURK